LIIAINNDSRREVDPQWHDTSFATKTWLQLLDTESETSQGKFAKFEELKAKWLRWGVPIQTPSQLLQRYYSTIKVICIPSDLVSSHATLKRQYEEAYFQIRKLASKVALMKADAELKLDTAQFQIYVREALDHFAKVLIIHHRYVFFGICIFWLICIHRSMINLSTCRRRLGGCDPNLDILRIMYLMCF
jgi:hypothetical protein